MSISYVVLAIAALLTSMISAVIGMAGGILLLAVMFCFLSHGEAIPVHGLVQLVSNTTRVVGFVRHVDTAAVARFAAGALPGAVLGFVLLRALGEPTDSEPYLKIVVGAYVLLAASLSRPAHRSGRTHAWAFTGVGAVAGTCALTIGAIGPLIAPVFARRGYVKERLVATKAVCQALMHLTKIPAFLWLGTLDIDRLGFLSLLMIVMVIPGTLLGKRILKGVTEVQFVRLYRAALFLAGTKVLIYDGLWRLLQPCPMY